MNENGQVAQLLVASAAGAEMTTIFKARAVPGQGLAGDRYAAGTGTFSPKTWKPDFELTLIEEENLRGFTAETGLNLTAAQARRNVVTQGVRLNDLAGVEFMIGSVRIRGVRLCEPCSYLAQRTFGQVLSGLVHKGGLRAQILTEGEICVGDIIRR